jgi:hypothetical protein
MVNDPWVQNSCIRLTIDGILGFDFQRTQDCTINVAKGSILIHGHKVSLQFERQLGCYQEAMTTVTVAPVSTNMVAFNPFSFAFYNISASLANLLTPIEPLL